MHRDLRPERGEFFGLAGEFERNQDADLAEAVGHRAVHVTCDRALADA